MIKDINYYRAIHNSKGCKTRAEMEKNQIRKRLDRNFENTLDIVEFENFLSGEIIRLEIKKETKNNSFGYQREFTSLITSPVEHGDAFYDESTKTYWLCSEAMCKSGLYYEGKLTRCNNILRWQDETGEIFNYPVYDYTGFNKDETDFRIVNVGEGKHKLVTIADKNTIKLKHDKRFFWDRDTENPTVFKITQNDSTSGFYDKGLITLTIMEDQYNKDTDCIEQWLCDYKKVEKKTLHIQFNGDGKIRIGRSRRVWIDTEEKIDWIIPDINGVSFEETGNSLKIVLSMNDGLIGEKIHISAVVGGNTTECEFEIIGGV